MKPSSLSFTLSILLFGVVLNGTFAQQFRTQNISSAGGGTSTVGTQRLVSVVGQPIAYNSSTNTEPKAGFLQVSRELISDNQPPVITYTTLSQGITQGTTATFTATITDNVALTSARIFYKPITSPASAFQNAPATAGTNNTYSATPQSTWFDAMGMEYYFTASDGSNNTARSPASGSYYSLLTTPSVQVSPSVLSAGTQASNYRIIAMPYTVAAGEAIVSVFGASSGLNQDNSKKSKWRLATYDPTSAAADKFIEYPDRLTNFDRGRGYWFILKDPTQIQLGQKTAPSNNRSNLFTLTLKPGWNMVGNPYPVPIKWSDVQGFQGNPTVGALNVYTGGFATGNDLAPFQGGFVNNTGSADITITIPFSGQSATGGRVVEQEPSSDISSTSWKVPLYIFQGETFNKLGGFGMTDRDIRPDELVYNPPSFVDGPEVNFDDAVNKRERLCQLMVPLAKEAVWRFTAEGAAGQSAELVWGRDLGKGSEPIMLLDEVSLTLTDMRQTNSYLFTLSKGHPFTVFYGASAEKIAPQKVLIVPPYPNPAVDRKVKFMLGLPESSSSYEIGFHVFGGSGNTLATDQKTVSSGLHSLEWQAVEIAPSGMYYYRIQVRSTNGTHSTTGKIVIP